ncbi:MAG: class II aldolase/adducin family protein [Gammaproteobacteria bacterium]|nr:class II aldolase/adducin family protein [Gammaproteobacteria bacterium]
MDTRAQTADSVREERKRQVALGYRVFAALAWGDLGDGHISARDPERADCFWLLDVDTPFGEASPGKLVLVKPDGSVEGGSGKTNLPAYYIHYPILSARPDIASVAHTHTSYGTPFSASATPFEPITQEACIFHDDHAVFDDEEVQVQSVDCGERIARDLGRNRGIVLRNHGLLTVGATVKHAVAWFVMMERVAEAHLKARDPKPISHNAALYAKADLTTDEYTNSVFDFLVGHHLEAH